MPKIILLLGRYLLLALLYIFIYRLVSMVIKEWRHMPRAKEAPARVFSSPVASPGGEEPRLAELVVLKSSDANLPVGTILPVGAIFLIGRSSANNLIIRDTFTSQEHARLTLQKGEFWLEDQGSTNGTNVNGRKIAEPLKVSTGDEIRVGETVLRFVRCIYEVD